MITRQPLPSSLGASVLDLLCSHVTISTSIGIDYPTPRDVQRVQSGDPQKVRISNTQKVQDDDTQTIQIGETQDVQMLDTQISQSNDPREAQKAQSISSGDERQNPHGILFFRKHVQRAGTQKTPLITLTPEQHRDILSIYAHSLTRRSIPYSFLQSSMITDILNTVGIAFDSPNVSTIHDWMTTQYRSSYCAVMKLFEKNIVQGSVTYGGWSKYQRFFSGITFHYLDRDFEMHSIVIGFEECFESSTGKFVKNQVGTFCELTI